MIHLPNIDTAQLHSIKSEPLLLEGDGDMVPRILLLYGSLRERSYSRLVSLECERLLQTFGAETELYHANELPMVDSVTHEHPAVIELRNKAQWCDGMVWVSPERRSARQ